MSVVAFALAYPIPYTFALLILRNPPKQLMLLLDKVHRFKACPDLFTSLTLVVHSFFTPIQSKVDTMCGNIILLFSFCFGNVVEVDADVGENEDQEGELSRKTTSCLSFFS